MEAARRREIEGFARRYIRSHQAVSVRGSG